MSQMNEEILTKLEDLPINTGDLTDWLDQLLADDKVDSSTVEEFSRSISECELDLIKLFKFENSGFRRVRSQIPSGKICLLTPRKGFCFLRYNQTIKPLEPGLSTLICGPRQIEFFFSPSSYECFLTCVTDLGIVNLISQGLLGIEPREIRVLLNDCMNVRVNNYFSTADKLLIIKVAEKRNAILAVLHSTLPEPATQTQVFAPKVMSGESSFNKVLKSIWNEPNTDWTLAHIGNITGYSPFHVCRLIQSELSISFRDYVSECRARRAIIAICHSNTNLAEIGSSVGFSNGDIFRRSIKHSTGFLPSVIRDFSNADRQ